MLAYCGIDCAQCPVLLATQADDDARRAKLAVNWGKMLGRALTSADVNCDGCQTEGARLFAHCRACAIRACCQGRGLTDCAACGDYACADLAGLFALAPAAREALEALRDRRGE